MPPQKIKNSSAKFKSMKLSKSQIRKLPEMNKLYQQINQYSLREEAYIAVLQTYIDLKKKIKS